MNCSICKEKIEGFGNNAQPINNGTCCDDCQYEFVLPARGIPYETSIKIKEYHDKSRRL